MLSTPKQGSKINRLTGDTISSSLKKKQMGMNTDRSVNFKEPTEAQFTAPRNGSYAQTRNGKFGFFAAKQQ